MQAQRGVVSFLCIIQLDTDALLADLPPGTRFRNKADFAGLQLQEGVSRRNCHCHSGLLIHLTSADCLIRLGETLYGKRRQRS